MVDPRIEIKSELVDKNEIVAPPILYKYRDWMDKWNKTILTQKMVYLAPPSRFEDKLDCKQLKRYDMLTEDEIYYKYLNLSKNENHHFSLEEHVQFAVEWVQKCPFKDPSYLREAQERNLKAFDRRMGVLSLTANPVREEMWLKYANAGTGFCVGFNSHLLFEHIPGGGVVQYNQNLPIIHPNDHFELENWKQVFNKECKWSFEEEYRTYQFYSQDARLVDRQVKLPQKCFNRIIFGEKMSNDHKNQIRNVCKSQHLTLDYYELERINGTVQLVLV